MTRNPDADWPNIRAETCITTATLFDQNANSMQSAQSLLRSLFVSTWMLTIIDELM
jgi:hypothetical protein